jgi:transcriptional regulator
MGRRRPGRARRIIGLQEAFGELPRLLLTIYMARSMLLSAANMSDEVPYGTLDLMILKTLDGMGPLHGYGIARRIEQMAEGMLALNQGTIYPALLRLEQRGWITSEWGTSENNRRARFYSITRAGRKQITVETDLWARTVAMMSRLLGEQP